MLEEIFVDTIDIGKVEKRKLLELKRELRELVEMLPDTHIDVRVNISEMKCDHIWCRGRADPMVMDIKQLAQAIRCSTAGNEHKFILDINFPETEGICDCHSNVYDEIYIPGW